MDNRPKWKKWNNETFRRQLERKDRLFCYDNKILDSKTNACFWKKC
jgi:hypothetical protein